MKKVIKALALAAVLVSMPVMVFAAKSPTSSDSGSGSVRDEGTTSSTGTVGTTASVGSTGSVSLNSTEANGTTVGVQAATTNAQGEAIVGDKAVAFATGVSATAGLPETAVAAINAINSGSSLAAATGNAAFEGYNALTGTHAVIVKDAATNQTVEQPVEVSLYVSNLMADLGQVSVAFYNNVTGQWTLIPITAMDLNAKTVSVKVPGNGTLSVVYKK